MDIYAPIADRLGISRIKVELDDLSLKYLQPDVYYDLAETLPDSLESVQGAHEVDEKFDMNSAYMLLVDKKYFFATIYVAL